MSDLRHNSETRTIVGWSRRNESVRGFWGPPPPEFHAKVVMGAGLKRGLSHKLLAPQCP